MPFAGGLIFLLFIVVKFLHKQSIRNLTTSRAKIDWSRVAFAFILWGAISITMTMVDIYLSPDDYVFNFEINRFLILAVIAICLVPLQTSFEEYMFRGYLMQGIGNIFRNKWVPLIVTSVAFGLLHIANPEVDKLGNIIMIYYIGTGFFLGILTLMDEGMELAQSSLVGMFSGIILSVDCFSLILLASPFLLGVKLLIYYLSTDYFLTLNYCFGISISSLVIDLVKDFLD